MTETGVMREALEALVEGRGLDTATARRVMDRMMDGEAAPVEMAAVLVALRSKGESVEELHGMVLSMREHATRVELPVEAVDTCGTGGDASGSFNISTAAALVVAGAACPVAKHGNRSASSMCGSADVLERLGVAVALGPEGVRRCVVEAGIGFLFAPAFHPAMRHVGPVRRELGIRTVFNILGPMANPAGVRRQVVGTPDPRLAGLIAEVLHRLGHRHALVVSGPEGLDELGLSGVSRCLEVTPEGVSEVVVDPSGLGFAPAPVRALAGGDTAENARHIWRVLEGEPGPRREVTVLNAAAALLVAGRAGGLEEGVEVAARAIDSGAARERLEALITTSQAVAAAG